MPLYQEKFFVFTYSSFNTGRCCCCCTLYCFSKNLSSYILHLSQIKSDWLSACVQNCSLSFHCSRDRFSFSVADRWCFFVENLDFSAELQAFCCVVVLFFVGKLTRLIFWHDIGGSQQTCGQARWRLEAFRHSQPVAEDMMMMKNDVWLRVLNHVHCSLLAAAREQSQQTLTR